MDADDYPSLGRLARLNAQLAAQRARVDAFVASQVDEIERLFRAATSHDWDAIARVSLDLAKQTPSRENSHLVRSAGKVCDALRIDPSGSKAAQPLAKLLDACRAAKKKFAQ